MKGHSLTGKQGEEKMEKRKMYTKEEVDRMTYKLMMEDKKRNEGKTPNYNISIGKSRPKIQTRKK